jgi:GNAT superfamily N-acetyltransferase
MFATRSDALVLASVASYRRFDGYTIVEVPSRRDFWHGHALILDREPEPEDQAMWIARHAEHFRGIDVGRHTIVWEVAGERERAPIRAPNVRGEIQRTIVFTRRSPYGGIADARVRAFDGDADWDASAALSALEDASASPEMRDFGHWRFGIVRSDAANGRMRMWGIWDGDELVAYAGIYASPTLARFTTPVTSAAYRGRGLFRALCATAVDATLRAHPQATIVICATADEAPATIYRRLGFEAVGETYGLLGERGEATGA